MAESTLRRLELNKETLVLLQPEHTPFVLGAHSGGFCHTVPGQKTCHQD